MKNKNVESKKIVHFLIIAFMLLALVFGFVFSAIETNKGIKLGSQYRGSFQAVVGVYDVNKKEDPNLNPDEKNLPNGDAKVGAEILQNKLSPFADGSVNVTIDGLYHLIVTAPRDAYANNQRLFINAIQSTGGLFIFNEENTDVMLDTKLMSDAALDGTVDKKSPTSELLGEVEQISSQVGITNRPFLKFKLKDEHFQKLNATGDNKTAPKLKMIVDTPTLLDTLRDYFSFAENEDQRDEYLQNFLDGVLKPLQNKINGGTEPPILEENDQKILKDFFQVNYWQLNPNGSYSMKTDSLLDPDPANDFVINSLKDLDGFKTLLYADQKPNHQLEYVNEVSKYVYDSNAKGADFTTVDGVDGKYKKPLNIGGTEIQVNQTFKTLTKHLLSLLLEKESTDQANNPFGIKDRFNRNLFTDFFLYNGDIAGAIPTATGAGNNTLPGEEQGKIIGTDFYLGTKNYTIAKKAAAQISQTTTGFTFHVFSVGQVDAIISNAMFIASIVVLLIIGLALAIFILFFYRLMGLFTIIVALTIGGLTLLMNVVFGIAMGPEIIAIMFVLIGLIMDISVVMFEAFKNNIYLEKRPIITSFNISNRETLGLVVDVLLASLLPNIVLFWIGIGFLNNFATILTMGIIFTFLLGVVVLRLLIYFTSRTSIWKKYPWLLPVDTSLDYEGRFINHYLILLKQEKLDGYTNQTQLNSKQLLKIKKLEEQLKNLKAKDLIFIEKKKAKAEKQNLRWQQKWQKQLKTYQVKRTKVKSKKRFAYLWINHYDEKIGYLNYLLGAGKNQEGESISVINDQLTRIETTTAKTGWITFFVTIFFTILAVIFSFTIGLNYSVNYGQGTQYYIYGTFVSTTYERMNSEVDWNGNTPDKEEKNLELNRIAKESKQTVLVKYDAPDNNNSEILYKKEWQALGVYRGYQYLISHNYLQYLDNSNRIVGVDFKDAVYAYGDDYSRIDPNSSAYVNEPWVSIITTNNLIPKSNGIKTAMQRFAGQYSGTWNPSVPKNGSGVLGMSLEPHTASTQMRQIGITFGIVLLALLVYMLIRFKWTYYVALALGLVLTLALTISLIIVFRVPFSIEALAGILGVLGFALTSGMLFLGRGKSIIGSKDEKSLNDYFDHEIELQAQKKHLKLNFKTQVQKMKKNHRQKIKALNKKDENYKKDKKALKKSHHQELVKFKNTQKTSLKKQFQEIKVQISLEARKNNFLKQIFANVLRFGILRTVFLASFYLVIGIVTAVTLYPIGVMGFTLVFGVIASTIVMMTIVLPVWIQLERRRIRMRYGYKKFVNNLKVTHEEQIISGLND